MSNSNDNSIYENTVKDCKILYKDKCGWGTSHGWDNLISEFSYMCEEINLRYYKKYRYRITIDQIKQKYGSLCIYCNVVRDPGRIATAIYDIIERVVEKLDEIKYDFKRVIDTPRFQKHELRIFDTKEELDESGFMNCVNVSSYESNGKYVKKTTYDIYSKFHMIPTRNVMLWHFRNVLYKIENFLTSLTREPDSESIVIRNFMCNRMEELTKKYEELADDTCEECGMHIDGSYRKRCTTLGWVSILCDKCAEKHNGQYEMDGKIYQNGKYIRDCEHVNSMPC